MLPVDPCRYVDGSQCAAVALPGTCGELVQGTLDGTPCLVSCPIDRFGIAEVCLQSQSDWEMPSNAPKAAVALQAGLAYLSRPEKGGKLRLWSSLPRGRGYASSTVDIGATLYALGQALGSPLPAADVARLAVRIEPSDSIIFPALALLAHRDGSFHELLGSAPALTVLVLDPGGEVNTLAFNRLNHRGPLSRLAGQHKEAFALLRWGIQQKSGEALGQAATLSAQAHQSILHNPLLEGVLQLARDVHALGVCRAHSGSLLGILIDSRKNDLPDVKNYVSRRIGHQAQVAFHRLVNGGPYHQDYGGLASGKAVAGRH